MDRSNVHFFQDCQKCVEGSSAGYSAIATSHTPKMTLGLGGNAKVGADRTPIPRIGVINECSKAT